MAKRRWWGLELSRLRADYENCKIPMKKVAEKHRTSLGTIARLARKHEWNPRRGWTNPLSPTIGALKIRKAFLIKRRENDLQEIERVEHKINHLIAFGNP